MTATASARVPVTVLTGFLGSGKTTLLNRILSEQHGKRIAVIENEFGEVGVDQDLVINAEEEVFEMNNGCICCTVRGDLIRILGNLMKRRDKFDYILIETTGMADPGPVAQTFFVDDEMQQKLQLDGIVTLVDAKHISMHIDDSDEAQEQIAFADVIVLNKIDLVTPAELAAVEARIAQINSAAKIYRAENAQIELDKVLHVGGFNLDRAMDVDPQFMEPEYPFEWGGAYLLEPGRYELRLPVPAEPAMQLVALPLQGATPADLESAQMDAVLAFSDSEHELAQGGAIRPGKQLYQLLVGEGAASFTLEIASTGAYALFTEHHPDEFDAALLREGEPLAPAHSHAYKPDHEHDEAVSSVGITLGGDLDADRLNRWLGDLLRTQGPDIFRMKGVLSIKGQPRRFVFQGVHMLFDGRPDREWGGEPRTNKLIFIGRNLDRAALNEGFLACLA